MPTDKVRIDWMPGRAAQEGLEIARQLYPEMGLQELIDRLFLTGLSAAVRPQWQPPALMPKSRQHWSLPPDLAAIKEASKAIPGKQAE